MKQYKVIALSVGGRANKIFSAGDIVNEDNFIPGRADELESHGFLKSISDDGKPLPRETQEDIDVEVSEPKEETEETGKENSILDAVKNSLGEKKDSKVTIDSISKKEIMKTLTELGIPFDNTASKTDLFELYESRGNY